MKGLLAALLCALVAGPMESQELESEAEVGEPSEAPAETTQRTHKSGFDRKAAFGGPNSPQAQVEEDDRITQPIFRFRDFDEGLHPWFDWKGRVNEKLGLQLSGHYVSLYQSASDSLTDEDDAWSGLFRLTTVWTLANRGKPNFGQLMVTFDQRHAFTDVAPADLAGEIGYLGVTGTLLNGNGPMIVNLAWGQALNGGDGGMMLGRFDPADYLNVLGYANPWTTFQNLAVLLDASVAFPDSSWGIGAGHWMGDEWWVIGTFNDANGAATDDLEWFDGGSEFFSQLSWGWSPSKDERFLKAITMSAWHVDERVEAGVASAEGITFSTNWTWRETWMGFFRLGYSDGPTPIYNQSVSGGFIRRFHRRSDLVGLGVNWGDPPAEGLPEQTTVEAFYRLQLAQNLALTPSVQYLKDPALNDEADDIWLASLRLRFTY